MTDIDIMSELATGNISLDDTNTENAEATTEQNTTTQPAQANSSTNYSFQFTKDNFVKFSNTLALIQNICNDCTISNGKIRQRTNDKHSLIEMDLTSVFGERDIKFDNLKNRLSLLGTFTLSDMSAENNILVQSNDSNFEFSDALSKLIIRRPMDIYLDNPYVPDDEYQNRMISGCTQDNVLFTHSFTTIEKKRISKVCELFGTNNVIFEFYGDTCKYLIRDSAKNNSSETSQTIALCHSLNDKKSALRSLPFNLDTPSSLEMTCYDIGGGACIFMCELNYYGIPIKIFTKERAVSLSGDED